MTTAPTPLHQECADFATSLRSAFTVATTTQGSAPKSFLRAADLLESAAAELHRLQAENERLRARIAERDMPKLQRLTTRREVMADGTVRVTRVRKELEAKKPLQPDALADKCEAWLQAGGVTNIVDSFEAGYRTAEATASIQK